MNKVAVVTGASKGIGASIVKSLAKEGYNVAIIYNNDYKGALNTENEIKKYGVESLIVKCDISKESEIINMVEKVIKKFNTIDVLVNNAGIAIDTTFEDKNIDNFKRILDVNLIGTFMVSKIIGEYMLKNKSGNIINVASTNALDTYYPESLDYDASKAGVISITHNLAVYYAPYIRVNAICPGWINTDMNKELDKDFVDNENRKILLNRFGEPKEVADVVKFLVSDEASYINNTIIRVDGGSRC